MTTQPQPDRILQMYVANARAAVERFNREFAAWQQDETDTIKPPDMMTAAIEFAGYIESIIGQLGGIDDH